jgi:hypothetical protein
VGEISGGFVTVIISGVMSLAPHPTRNLEDQALHFVWHLPFELSGKGGTTRSLHSSQHSSPGQWDAQTSSPRKHSSPRGGDAYLLFLKFEYGRNRNRLAYIPQKEMRTPFITS